MKKVKSILFQIKDKEGTWQDYIELTHNRQNKFSKLDQSMIDSIDKQSKINAGKIRRIEKTTVYESIFEYRKANPKIRKPINRRK